MIKSELIKDPIDLYIKYSIIIDLDTLDIIHNKLVNANCSEIEYKFSVRKTNYVCNTVNEIRTIFSQEGISEIAELNINCRTEQYNTIFIKFGGGSNYHLSIHSFDPEPKDLMKEILAIINDNNILRCKWLTKLATKYENIALAIIIFCSIFGSTLLKIPNEWKSHAIKIFFVIITVCFIILIFSSRQKARIIKRKSPPLTLQWFLTFKNLALGITSSIIATLLCGYFIK